MGRDRGRRRRRVGGSMGPPRAVCRGSYLYLQGGGGEVETSIAVYSFIYGYSRGGLALG